MSQVGEGLEALASLDFSKAMSIFEGLLSRFPGHPDASAGLVMATEWASILGAIGTQERHDAAAALWARTKSYAFGQGGQKLRKHIIQRAIALLDGDPRLYVPPDLSLGRLLLKLGDYEGARKAIEGLLDAHGPNGAMMISLANCLFLDGKETEARFAYAKAFLLVPWEVERDQIEDERAVAGHHRRGCVFRSGVRMATPNPAPH